jgi:hypothetical protein
MVDHVDEACCELIAFRVGESWPPLLFLSSVARDHIGLQPDSAVMLCYAGGHVVHCG